jgi:hypothetical protein
MRCLLPVALMLPSKKIENAIQGFFGASDMKIATRSGRIHSAVWLPGSLVWASDAGCCGCLLPGSHSTTAPIPPPPAAGRLACCLTRVSGTAVIAAWPHALQLLSVSLTTSRTGAAAVVPSSSLTLTELAAFSVPYRLLGAVPFGAHVAVLADCREMACRPGVHVTEHCRKTKPPDLPSSTDGGLALDTDTADPCDRGPSGIVQEAVERIRVVSQNIVDSAEGLLVEQPDAQDTAPEESEQDAKDEHASGEAVVMHQGLSVAETSAKAHDSSTVADVADHSRWPCSMQSASLACDDEDSAVISMHEHLQTPVDLKHKYKKEGTDEASFYEGDADERLTMPGHAQEARRIAASVSSACGKSAPAAFARGAEEPYGVTQVTQTTSGVPSRKTLRGEAAAEESTGTMGSATVAGQRLEVNKEDSGLSRTSSGSVFEFVEQLQLRILSLEGAELSHHSLDAAYSGANCQSSPKSCHCISSCLKLTCFSHGVVTVLGS